MSASYGLWTVALLALIGRAVACKSDWDCQLNGVCADGACTCSPAWGGDSCDKLQLSPGKVAYGCLPESISGAKPNCSYTSWGGGPPTYDDTTGKWVLFVSQMAGKCGLSVWQHWSTVVSATADTPFGPFTPQELTIPAEAHNAYFVQDPVTKLNLIYHIGSGVNNGSKPLPTCTNGTTPASGLGAAFPGPAGKDYSPEVVASASLSGPFTHVNISGVPAGPLPRGASNPAPFIFDNGTTLMLFRLYNATNPKLHTSRIFVARAPRFTGPYEVLSEILHPHGEPTFNSSASTHVQEEDPTLWRDKQGHFHALFHFTHGHAWSEDGITWGWSQPRGPGGTPAWYTTVELDNGTVVTLHDSERPRVWINPKTGDPELLFVASGGQHQPVTADGVSRGFTVVQRINTRVMGK